MRVLAVLLIAIVLTLVRATPGATSCRPPLPLPEQAALAMAVIHGTVADASGGALTVRVDRVFKGDAATPIRVFVGPGRGVGATSVDYAAASGSEQMLYLIHGTDGELETNACIGSHPGPATAEELAYFGAGTAPTAGSPEILVRPTGNHPVSIADLAPLWAALAVVLAAASAAVMVLRRRRTSS